MCNKKPRNFECVRSFLLKYTCLKAIAGIALLKCTNKMNEVSKLVLNNITTNAIGQIIENKLQNYKLIQHNKAKHSKSNQRQSLFFQLSPPSTLYTFQRRVQYQ